jgi:hypothetical protein
MISESETMREARAADPCRLTARAHVIDLSEHEGTTSPTKEEAAKFRSLGASYAREFGNIPTVLIATLPHIFGEARIFEATALLQEGVGDISVVHSWEEAEAILGMSLTVVREEILRRKAAAAGDPGPEATSSG